MLLLSRVRSEAPEILVAFLVFSLSSGVVGGVLLYLDSVGPEVLSEMSVDTPIGMQIHFQPEYYEQNTTSIDDIIDRVAEQPQTRVVEPLSIIEIFDDEIEDPKYSRTVVLGVDPDFFEMFSNIIQVSSSVVPLNDTNCYVQKEMFDTLELQFGDNFTLSVPSTDEYQNPIRINSTFTIAGTFGSDLYKRRITADQEPFSYLYVMTTREKLQTTYGGLESQGPNSLQDKLWVNFDIKQLFLSDPSTMVDSLTQMERQLEQDMLPFASVVEFKLISVAYEYSNWATSMRIIALAFAVPSVIMGIMLIQYNTNLLAQRRNVGALKTRGASGRQAVSWVLTMSIFTGIVGSAGAVITGVAAAFLAGGVRELMTFNLVQMMSFGVNLKIETVMILFSFSFVLGFIVSLPGSVGAFLMSPSDAHSVIERKALSPKRNLGNPVYHVLLVSVSGVLLIPLVGVLESFESFTIGSAFLGLTVILLLSSFIVGFVLLFSHPATALKSKILLHFKNQSIVVGTQVIGKSSQMFRRNEVMAIVFVSLVFTAGIFSSLAASTGNNHMKELFMFETGGDIVIDVKPNLANITLDFIPLLESIKGVSDASGMFKSSVRVTFYSDWNGYWMFWNRSIDLYGIQPKEWLDSAFILPYFTYYDDAASSIMKLEDNDTNVITNFQPILGYTLDSLGRQSVSYSDRISLELVGPSKHYMNCTIVDIMSSNPSGYRPMGIYGAEYIGTTFIPGEDETRPFIMLDVDSIHNYLNVSYVSKFYVNLEDGANYTRIIEEIGDLAPYSFERIDSPFFGIDAILDSRAGQTIHGAYTLNVLFSILYLTAGLTLVMTIKIRTMSKHFSLLRALGTESRSIIGSVLIDSVATVLMGGIIGCVTGLILTILAFQMPLNYLGLSTEVLWETLPLELSVPVALLASLVITAILASLFISYVIIRRKLVSNIAEDIQHSE
ncbi:MAG: FtsX-like permease family protein [Promethearchaeota archaeon]